LGFVITQVVFKAKGAGEGFRRFRIGDGEWLRVVHVDDMVMLKPFPGVGNRTSIVVLQKDAKTRYPVPYTRWTIKPGQSISEEMSLDEIESNTVRKHLQAEPIGDSETGAWQTGSKTVLRSIKAVLGTPAYKARRGAGTDPYGVYWVDVLQLLPDGNIVIQNQHDAGKTEVELTQTAIEDTLLYPGLRGRGIKKWSFGISGYIVLAQDPKTRLAYPEDWLKTNLPRTYSYLRRFKEILESRKSNFVRGLMERSAFYAMYGIGDYTLAETKVCWQRAGNRLKAVVVGLHRDDVLQLTKPVIPADTTSFITVPDHEEAHYICALMNSVPVARAVRSYSEPGRGFGSPSIIEHIGLPAFDPEIPIHSKLAALSQQAHQSAVAGDKAGLTAVEAEVDEAAAELWGITDRELKEIRRSLEELG
jgi:hypothetical protein